MHFYRSFFLIGACLVLSCQQRPGNNHTAATDTVLADTGADVEVLPVPARVETLFADSANRALFWDEESKVEASAGGLRVDGRSLIYLSAAELPLQIQTALMHIDVLELPLLVHIDAFDTQAGQALEVYSGALKVSKSYASPFPDVDTLRTGNLYMINKDIDLSEKERLDDLDVLHWWKETYSKAFPNALGDGY